jgi:hypothetical protein
MSRFDDILSEAAYAISGAGFGDSIGSVDELGWYGRVEVSTVLLLNIGETTLADQFAREHGDHEYDVIIHEDSQGFVDVDAFINVSTSSPHAPEQIVGARWAEIEWMCNPSDDDEDPDE